MNALLDFFSDQLNPVLVKEVRQSMRGRYFRVVYILTIFVAMFFGMLVLLFAGDSDEAGTPFFFTIYGCLVLAVSGLIPLQAFLSVGISWDREAMDMLNLTGIRPRQIVMGRLASSVTQGGLMTMALLPFLAMSYLLPGVDPLAMVVVLATTLAFGVMVVCIALLMSWLTSNRLLRVLMLALLGMGLFMSSWTAFMSGIGMMQSPEGLQSVEALLAILVLWLMFFVVAGFCLVASVARLSHREENRSTWMRLYIIGILFISYLGLWSMGTYPGMDPELSTVLYALALLSVMPGMALLVTEPERMGRRVQLQVSKNPVVAFFLMPLYPSGGTGAMFCFLMVLSFMGAFLLLPPVAQLDWLPYEGSIIVLGGYTLWALMVPSVMTSPWTVLRPVRIYAVMFIPLCVMAVLFIPTLLGLLLDLGSLERMEHLGNPIWVLSEINENQTGGRSSLSFWLLLGVVFAMLVNGPRMVRAAIRVQQASSRNRGRDATPST
jgi:hypothetical protein